MQAAAPAALPTRLAVWVAVLAPFTKFALILTPIATALEELLPGGGAAKRGWAAAARALGMRTALVASALAVAVALPFFAYLMARGPHPCRGPVLCCAGLRGHLSRAQRSPCHRALCSYLVLPAARRGQTAVVQAADVLARLPKCAAGLARPQARADCGARRVQAFVGSLLAMTSCVTVPALCYLAIRAGEPLRPAERAGIWAVAALGVALAAAGTADAVLQISGELGAR
jgi:hypothetical protein